MTDLRTTRALIAEAERAVAMRKSLGHEKPTDLIRRLAAALSVFAEREAALFHGRIPEAREETGLDGRTCSYCFKRPATAVDDDLDAICSECAVPVSPTPEEAEQ